MERVYLLLRDNEQTGPFTIGELLQQQLRPTDMIWIEGKSTAWTYLSELELNFHVTEPEPETPKPMSADEIERKAEELRHKVLTSTPRAFDPHRPVQVESFGPPYNIGEDEIEFVDYRKRKSSQRNLVVTESLLTVIVIGLFITGIYKGKSFLATKKQVPEAAAVKLNTGDEHAARKASAQPQTVQLAAPVDTVQQSADSLQLVAMAQHKAVVEKKRRPDSSAIKPATVIPAPEEAKPDTQEVIQKPEAPVTAAKKPDTQVTKKQPEPAVVQKKDENNDKDEKKGFLRGLFKKKKKGE